MLLSQTRDEYRKTAPLGEVQDDSLLLFGERSGVRDARPGQCSPLTALATSALRLPKFRYPLLLPAFCTPQTTRTLQSHQNQIQKHNYSPSIYHLRRDNAAGNR
jgi:hypothetical protein